MISFSTICIVTSLINQINDLGFMYSEAGVAKFSIPENYFDRGGICSYPPTKSVEIVWVYFGD